MPSWSSDVFSALVAVMIVVALAGIVAFYGPPTGKVNLTDSELCEDLVVEWSGYAGCWKEKSCQLGNEEMFEMYRLNKAATMACERAATRNRLYVPPLLPEEVL